MPENTSPPQHHHTINTHAYKNTYEQTHISTQAKEELSCPEKDLWIRTAEPPGGLAEAQLSSTEIRFGWIGISAGMWPKKAAQAEKKKKALTPVLPLSRSWNAPLIAVAAESSTEKG